MAKSKLREKRKTHLLAKRLARLEEAGESPVIEEEAEAVPSIEIPEKASEIVDLIQSEGTTQDQVAEIYVAEQERSKPRKTVLAACEKALNVQ